MIFQRKALTYWSQLVANRHLKNPQTPTAITSSSLRVWYTLHQMQGQSNLIFCGYDRRDSLFKS